MADGPQNVQEVVEPAPAVRPPFTPGRVQRPFRGRGRGRAAWMARRRQNDIINGWIHTVSALTGRFGPSGQVQFHRNLE